MPIGRGALRFAADHLHDVFRGVPVVLALGAAPEAAFRTARNFTGRFAAASRFAPTLSMARRLQPDAKQVVIVGGAGPE